MSHLEIRAAHHPHTLHFLPPITPTHSTSSRPSPAHTPLPPAHHPHTLHCLPPITRTHSTASRTGDEEARDGRVPGSWFRHPCLVTATEALSNWRHLTLAVLASLRRYWMLMHAHRQRIALHWSHRTCSTAGHGVPPLRHMPVVGSSQVRTRPNLASCCRKSACTVSTTTAMTGMETFVSVSYGLSHRAVVVGLRRAGSGLRSRSTDRVLLA